MITRVSSRTRTVEISPEGPTVLIGERISPSARKGLGEALLAGDYSMVRKEALDQVAAGAQIIDVVVSYQDLNEIAAMREAVKAVMGVTDAPLCVDSADPAVLEAALGVYEGKMLVSSVTGEETRIRQVLPLVKRYGSAVIALTTDETGIPGDAHARLAVARKIVTAAEAMGIPREDVIVDCACMTVGTDTGAALVTLEAARLIREELGCNLTLGVSNVSYGLPDRRVVNMAFLPLALAAGVNCPIVDPTAQGLREIILATDLLLNRDRWATRYTRNFKAKRAAASGN
jgi:5-methyltetrahydrofolate--homocysteine methyltransferase